MPWDLALGGNPSGLESLAMQLSEPSILNIAYQRRALFRGAPTREGATFDARLWKLLGVAPPQEALVSPVILKERVVLMIYAHGLNGGPLPDQVLADIALVSAAATSGLVNLIQTAKARGEGD
jgi:hypothetical protein